MDGDVSGVRISPPVVEFHDTEPHNVHQLNVTVKNISKTSKSIRFYGPKTKYFQLRVKNPTKPVASGLCVPAVVEFETAESKEIKDRLVVTVDGDVIEIPLVAYPTQPVLEIESEVNFGNLVANSKTIAKEISLINHGSKAGEFKIKYTGDKPIAIMPSSGSVPPKSVQLIKVEYVTKQAGNFEEIIKVKLEGQETKSVYVKGTLVDRAIEVLSIENEQPLGCVRFGSTYYGTDITECALLYNNGPEPVNFVAVLDEDAIGQEMGVDLTRSTVDALKEQDGGDGEKSQGNTNVITSLITAIPNQGTLKPYQKFPVFFRFSPRWNASKEGWKSQVTPPPRKDFALFMKIQIIGSSNGFLDKSSPGTKNGSMVEIAFTGTALPVLLTISPSTKYNFNECPVGEHADVLCTIHNDSDVLPAIFQFRKIAHFSCHPPSGKISPGSMQDVIFSFAPSQIGSFKQKQLMDVIGQVADNRNPTLSHLQIIHTYPIFFSGRSDPIPVKKNPRFNTGLTPYISNEVGMFVETTVADIDGNPRNAVAGGHKSQMHRLRASAEDPDAKVAFPNDRAQSIRPEHDEYRTIFTHTSRHSYVDPDYMLTNSETDQKYNDRDSYKHMLRKMRQDRLNRIKAKEFKDTNNKVDIGIKSAAGLKPKYLTQQEIRPDPKSPQPPNADYRLLSSKELSAAESEASYKEVYINGNGDQSSVCEGLNAVPTTAKEKAECKKVLSPQQLHQIVIGPPVLDFGLVCLRSVVTNKLNIVNNLDQYIHIVAEIDCRELRQSSPLSQVIPPKSKAHLPIVFESSTKGKFQRSVSYCVNGFYKHHVTVVAEVVPVALELSTEDLILKPSYGLPAEAGFRGVITLKNKQNYPAEFTWAPNLGEKGTAFSIRPATGTVDAYKDLDCEVVWHPSYLAPEDGSFSLMIHGGQTLQLRCLAELGPTAVQFVERRIMFGQTPINITTTRTALLANTGQNHAYFQVMDPNPFPGLSVSPVHGVVPVGGHAELKVQLTPSAILKFDTRVQVAIKGGKTLELRMGGTVEPPIVDIDVPTFDFGGVYCGSGSTLMFKLTNKAVTKAKLEFDLTRYRDFTLNFPGYQTQDDYSFQLLNPGMFTVTMAPEETIEGEIIFMPSEVAAYDFVMPVIINQIGAPSPAPTPFPPTPAPSNKNSLQHIINPRPQPVQIDTPRKHVIATALRQPLQLSTNKIEFSLPSTFVDPTASTGLGVSKYRIMEGTVLVNNSDKTLKWMFDLSAKNRALEEGILKFTHPSGAPFVVMGGEESMGIEGTLDPGQTQQLSVAFCPREPGRYECLIPVLLNDGTQPYQYLQVIAEMKSPKLWFDPLAIVMTPVPLLTEVATEFTVLASQYTKPTEITVEVPEVECEDGSTIAPLTVAWSDGTAEIMPCCADEGQIEPFALSCKVIFSSPKPVSFSEAIRFIDSDGRVFQMMITATADNCLLTCYPFLALHRTDHQIVCEQGASPKGRKMIQDKDNAGEAVFIPCVSPQHNSRPSTSATSSNFQISSSSYESSASVTDSTEESTPVNRDGAMNKPPSGSEHNASRGPQDLASRSLGSAMFPDEDTEEGIFHMEVLLGVQRWFSSQGWSGGQFPIIIPHSLRCGISRKPITDDIPKAAKAGSWDANNLKKEFKTIYDMINNLSGRAVPGIPLNSPLPSDPIERVKQIFWQHATLLTFLRCQGACVASIKAEYLLETRDYHLWKQMQKQLKMELIKQGEDEQANQMDEEEELEEDVFEAVSKRSWTDILLQLFKTLVLAKVTPRTLKNTQSPDKNIELPSINPDPLSSNIYGVAERILLSWLNHHYETYRERIWKNCAKGGVPPSRWIVNYDFDLLDGLVLGAVLGAHMPFLIKTHLQDMYSHPSTAEQCLHNALKVVNAMRYAGIDYDIQAIDITDPNPIALLMLCVNLFQRLPQYLPKATVDFTGRLHSTVCRQVKLSNPSGKPLHYHVLIAGHDARDFKVPRGDIVTISPKSTLNLNVEFTSRFLRPAEAILVLVGHRHGSAVGSTLTFSLRTQIDNITPKHTIKSESPCYELERIPVKVVNPFDEGGEFRIVLVEASTDLLDPNKPASLMKPKEKRRRKIKAKIDHGMKRPETPPTPPPPKTEDSTDSKKNEPPMMSAFFSPVASMYLEPHGTTNVEIHFLPFSVGDRQCSVIFLNESIGEFLYSIEATATLPLSSVVPFVKTPHSVRISSAEAAGSGKGLFGGDDRVVYWKCESGQTLKEAIVVPITNRAKEKALLMAAQQHMSDTELHRRLVTGTISTSSVTAKTVMTLSTNAASSISQAKSKSPAGTTYVVESDSEFYKLPKKFTIPLPDSRSNTAVKYAAGEPCIELPITFKATETGHYPCQIVLRAPDDVRVYKVECTVNPEGSTAELDFRAPVHQSVTQELPIVNMTNHDWPLKASIEGTGFFGPPMILAKAYNTTKYPLIFKPQNETLVQGKLVLSNTEDGTDHVFHLRGKPQKPLALDHIIIKCEAKKSTPYQLTVPNVTKKKLCYRVESDLSFISGNTSLTVLPGNTGVYNADITPVRRGVYKGIVAFIAGKNPVIEVDSDGDEIVEDDDEESRKYYGYRIWYSLEIHVKPPPPERIMAVECCCHKKAVLEVIVRNPTPNDITLDVTIEGRDLIGEPSISLEAGAKDVYTLTFAPAVIGKHRGSLIFFHKSVGEFWYDLRLKADSPPPTTLPHMECDLGRWTKQSIYLDNPTNETLELIPTVSNTNNFSLERDNERPIVLRPHSVIEVPIHFMPSTLGHGDHLAKVIFHSEQLGEWIFVASGTGLLPQPQEPVSVFTEAGSNTTLIIPFRNPMDHAVLVDAVLQDNNIQMDKVVNGNTLSESAFCLLLKHSTAIRVGPKSTLDIPVCFAPTEMTKYEALCTVIVRKEDGSRWQFAPKDSNGSQLSRTGFDGLHEIRWLYPINGIPESKPIKDSLGAVIECKARDRVEERLEVTLSGVAPASSGPHRSVLTRSVTPKDSSPKISDGIVIGETLATASEFEYELNYPDDDAKDNLQNSVALKLVRTQRDTASGLVIVVFNLIYAPFKAMSHNIELVVRAATGGLWRFPLKFTASEPQVDDNIVIEATGLNKESSVGFRLTSQTKHPVMYNAFFAAGSDPEFTVSPQTGELLPQGTNGTLLAIKFVPAVYGKIYRAKLVIQTPDMQWSYDVRGVLPQYTPPRGKSGQPMAGPHPDPRIRGERLNYIRENLKLLTTAVSSPVKGAPILQRSLKLT